MYLILINLNQWLAAALLDGTLWNAPAHLVLRSTPHSSAGPVNPPTSVPSDLRLFCCSGGRTWTHFSTSASLLSSDPLISGHSVARRKRQSCFESRPRWAPPQGTVPPQQRAGGIGAWTTPCVPGAPGLQSALPGAPEVGRGGL